MEYICRVCKYVGKPKKKAPGNIFIEIILWLLLIIPGIIYSLYRMFSKKPVCAKCGSNDIVPLNTPEGQALSKS